MTHSLRHCDVARIHVEMLNATKSTIKLNDLKWRRYIFENLSN